MSVRGSGNVHQTTCTLEARRGLQIPSLELELQAAEVRYYTWVLGTKGSLLLQQRHTLLTTPELLSTPRLPSPHLLFGFLR